MGHVAGKIERCGPILAVVATATPYRVEEAKRSGREAPPPRPAIGLIDTGASCSAVDIKIIEWIGLDPTGSRQIHTSSTGLMGAFDAEFYDITIAIEFDEGGRNSFTVEAFGLDLRDQPFDLILGWDVLSHFRLNCNGPKRRFSLKS